MIVRRKAISRVSAFFALTLLLSCGPDPDSGPEPEGGEGPGQIALPIAAEISSACFASPTEMMEEESRQAVNGVHIEPTFEEWIVRREQCDWQARRPPTARCRFEEARIPMGSQEGEERTRYLKWLKDRHWTPRSAILTYRRGEGWAARGECLPLAGRP